MFAIKYRKVFAAIALAIFTLSIAIIGFLGLLVGIDFTGGSLTEVSYSVAPEKAAVEEVIAQQNLGGFSVRESASDTGKSAFLIRTRDLTESERSTIENSLTTIGTEGEVTRFTSIGPVIGQELRDKAGWAVMGVVTIIVLYVAFAFAGIGTPVSSWMYGLVTILVLIHDVLVPTALMSILGYTAGIEVDTLFVMAILAVLGYSVNDTIVIFDRVRENLIKNRTEQRTKRTEPGGVEREDVVYTLTAPYADIVGSAVSETMARSINTSLTTIVALLALYFLGGGVTQTFALILITGVVAGTYSSIFIASPLVVVYADYLLKKQSKNDASSK
jgi:preprotein translocase subunit SecF